MKKVKLICKILTLIGLGSFFGCGSKMSQAQTDDNIKKVSFDEQMKVFKDLGFEFNEGASETDIINMWGKEELENEPYSLLYISLGAQVEREPWTPITNQCWHFDTEAIEDEGAYVDIIENLKRLSDRELNFTNITDVVDWDNQKASVSFELNGDKYSWDLEFDNDWIDPSLFSKIVKLTEKYETKGRFTYYDTGGQDLVIGWTTPEKLDEIKSKTGLEIVWLN